jgi:LacI family transcriptional regulator
LYGKKGVSDKRREEIQSIALSLGYEPIAAEIEKSFRIAVVFPKPVLEDRYFYQYVWKGINCRAKELEGTHCEVIKYPFEATVENQIQVMQNVLEIEKDNLDGLVTIIWDEHKFKDILDAYSQKGIKIFTVSSSAPREKQVSTILANPYRMGRLAAEYLGSTISQPGHVIIMGTRRDSGNHAQVVNGFFDQMTKTNPAIQIIELYESVEYPEKIYETLKDFLEKFDDIKGIYVNNARTTSGVCSTIRGIKETNNLRIVGAELFPESIQAMNEGILQALIDQNPYEQGYRGLSVAYQNIALEKEVQKRYEIPTLLYLVSNLPDIENL